MCGLGKKRPLYVIPAECARSQQVVVGNLGKGGNSPGKGGANREMKHCRDAGNWKPARDERVFDFPLVLPPLPLSINIGHFW